MMLENLLSPLNIDQESIHPRQWSVASSSNKPFDKGSTSSNNEVRNEGTVQKPSDISNYAQKCYRCQGYGHIASNCPIEG